MPSDSHDPKPKSVGLIGQYEIQFLRARLCKQKP